MYSKFLVMAVVVEMDWGAVTGSLVSFSSLPVMWETNKFLAFVYVICKRGKGWE